MDTAQFRMACAALNLNDASAAQLCAVSIAEIDLLRTGTGADLHVVGKVTAALEAAGITFIDDESTSGAGGPGVRFTLSRDPDVVDSNVVQYPEYLEPDASTGAGG
jgi:hypothetical protein